MKKLKDQKKSGEGITWEEQSGLLDFLSSVNGEVDKFNESFEFGISTVVPFPADIDGDTRLPLKIGFVLKRENILTRELSYCLYSLLKNQMLYGFIGSYKDGSITTIKELKPIKNFKKGKGMLYDWLSQLIKASCEKIVL